MKQPAIRIPTLATLSIAIMLLMIGAINANAQKNAAAQRQNKAPKKPTAQTVALDEWEVFSDHGKLYGFKNKRTGKTEWQPKFEYLRPFNENENLTVGILNGKYYMFDRNGRSLLNKGVDYIYYWPEKKYAEVCEFNDHKNYIINLQGEVIVPKYKKRLNSGSTDEAFLVEEPDGEHARLVTLDQCSISDLRFENEYWNAFVASMTNPDKIENHDCNFVIIFTQDEKQGVMSLQGEILIPAEYDEIDFAFIDSGKMDEYMRIIGNVCPKEFLQTFCYLCCKNKLTKTFTYYDYAGTLLGKKDMKKFINTQYSTSDFKKHAKTVFVPYFKDYARNLERLQEKVFAPSEKHNARKQAFINALPATPRFSALNILDMIGDTQAKKQENEQKANTGIAKADPNVQKFTVSHDSKGISCTTQQLRNIDNAYGDIEIDFFADLELPIISFIITNLGSADHRVKKVINMQTSSVVYRPTLTLTLTNGEQYSCLCLIKGDEDSTGQTVSLIVCFPALGATGFGVEAEDDRKDCHAVFDKLSTYDVAEITMTSKYQEEEVNFIYDFTKPKVQHTAPTIRAMLKRLRAIRDF